MEFSDHHIKGLETSLKKMQEDVKHYEKLVKEVGNSERKAAQDLSTASQNCEQLRTLVEDWLSFTTGVLAPNEQLTSGINNVWLDPIKKFQCILPEVKTALKKREHLIQECEKYKTKVQKLVEKEKTGGTLAKLNSARNQLATLQEELGAQERRLLEELPLLLDLAPQYLQPSLSALVAAQVAHTGEVASLFSSTVTHLPSQTTDYKAQQAARLKSIQALTIVAGSPDQ